MTTGCTARLFLCAVALSFSAAAFGQCRTIAAAKALATGTTVDLCDVQIINVTDLISSTANKSIQVQDATGGLTVFGTNAVIDAILGGAALGDRIDLRGVTGSFNGLAQLQAPFTLLANDGNFPLPAPTVITGAGLQDGAALAEQFESTFVRINCASFISTGTFAGVTNYTASDSGGNFTVRVATAALDLVGQPIPTDTRDLIGILGQFDTTDPRTGGYQLQPIRFADVIANPSCGATGACCVGTTCSVVTGAACAGLGGTFTPGATCSPNPCLPCSTVAAARGVALGTRVRLCNVVVSSTTDLISSAASASFQVQDSTGGVTVFGTSAIIADLLTNFAAGDQIDIEGNTGTFNGLFQLINPVFVANDGPVGIPTPQVITSAALVDDSATAESFESELVRIECVIFADGGGTFASGAANYIASDATGSVTIRVSTSDLGFGGAAIPTGPVNVTGIHSQFDSTDPRTSGYQLLMRSLTDIVESPSCPIIGACCQGTQCSIQTPAGCATLGGVYQGDGSACIPFNPCVPATGACCQPGTVCSVTTEAECTTLGGLWLGRDVPCGDTTCPEVVQPGDLSFGLSNGNPTLTNEQLRAGTLVGKYNRHAFAQSVEFDNHAGTLHNAAGNLLALNFGAGGGAAGSAPSCADPLRLDEGGKLVSYATNGSDAGQLLYEFDTRHGGIACTRVAGLGVSPDNNLLSMIGFDNGHLYVLDYSAGSAVGTGAGASITDDYEFRGADGFGFAPPNVSQGTTWFDNDTIIAFIDDRALVPGVASLYTVDFNVGTGTFTETLRTSVNVDDVKISGSRFTDVEYNPSVAPFIFCHYSRFDATFGTRNTLAIVDPATWTVIKTVSLDGGMPITLETGREIALGPDRLLYISQFGSRIDTLNIDTVAPLGTVTAADIAALTDDSSVNYYVSTTNASFNGIDVAFGGVTPTCITGDSNGDGLVNFDDISCFVASLVSESAWLTCGTTETDYVCINDINGDGRVDFDDIGGFVNCLVAGTCD